MRVVLDANAISDWMKSEPQFDRRLRSLEIGSAVYVPAIALGELYWGIQRMPASRRREELVIQLKGVLKSFRFAAVNQAACLAYGKLKAELSSSGIGLRDNDLWIAATALSLRAVLVTRDRDFRWIQSLQVQDWTQR